MSNEEIDLKAAEYENEHHLKKKRKDPRIESEDFEEIPITDPITGKVSIHKVKITKYKSAVEKQIGNKGISEELEGSEDLILNASFDEED